MSFSLVCSQTQQLVVGNTLVSGPTCKCAHVKQVPSVFPCTSPTLCHCDLRILTLHDDIAASDWIHWVCAVTMCVIIKAKSKETRFCRAAYSVLLVHSECWWSYSAKWHCSKKANTWFYKGGSNGCKTLLLALKCTSQQMFLETDVYIYIYIWTVDKKSMDSRHQRKRENRCRECEHVKHRGWIQQKSNSSEDE